MTKKILIFISLLSFLLLPATAWGATDIFNRAIYGGFTDTVDRAYGGSPDASVLQGGSLVVRVIFILNFLLTIIGVVFFGLLVYSGFLWMTARGNEELVNKSKKISREVVTGILIILTARIITEAVLFYFGSKAQL